MGIFRSTDPTTFDDVDGIVINESAPAPNVAGVAANVGLLVGQTQRGPSTVTEVSSIGEFHEIFGKSLTHGVNIALKNKKFGRLKIVRVVASDGVVASKAFQSSTTDRITFSALAKGAYGNNIQVKIESGTTVGKKYTIHDNNSYAVLPDEVYDNVEIASIDANTFAASKLVSAVVNSSAAEPTNAAYTNLASGAEGTVADTDYQTAIALCEVEKIGNFICLDSYNATRNGYLKTHVANTQDKMALLAGAESDSVSTAIAAVASLRDTDGRLIYCYPWIQTSLDGVLTQTSPAPWMLSILTQTAPNVDPAYAKNVQFMAGALDLKLALTRTNYINLKNAGICAFEKDDDLGGIKPKSGIVTQILDSSKVMIMRRRMADFLTDSVGLFLKNYQNAVNSKQNRSLVKGAMLAFIDSLERDGILPKDADVQGGKAKLVDTESLNTNASIAAGFFKILWRQRIFSSMRYIVLQAEIGESVVVTEQAS
jgi:23S rRNA U2552 (ribose-2'-O)-methylase RlmE/FtsJ